MDQDMQLNLREQAQTWTCNNVSITNHDGDTVALLRSLAETIEQLGNIEIMDITYRKPNEPSSSEITVTVYFYFISTE